MGKRLRLRSSRVEELKRKINPRPTL